RSQLLHQIGVRHRVVGADIDETPLPGEKPLDYVQRIAAGKAQGVVARLGGEPDAPVLAADTTVVLGERLFGKPAGEADCLEMLGALAGQRHAVLTAVALRHGNRLHRALDTSYVTFRAIDPDEGRRYWASGEPAGKAGGYAIQGLGAVFVARLEGSFSGVMGLPLFETAALLDAAGVRRWQRA
ncbi:MAG TPA: nucleoside triphosphate pyrophosphatase, partial [Steroidobacteraceae bacterium]|nr:nucleoside triphosphate pyrophosphatase [Steroidobacteraceae bacterium]